MYFPKFLIRGIAKKSLPLVVFISLEICLFELIVGFAILENKLLVPMLNLCRLLSKLLLSFAAHESIDDDDDDDDVDYYDDDNSELLLYND